MAMRISHYLVLGSAALVTVRRIDRFGGSPPPHLMGEPAKSLFRGEIHSRPARSVPLSCGTRIKAR